MVLGSGSTKPGSSAEVMLVNQSNTKSPLWKYLGSFLTLMVGQCILTNYSVSNSIR